MYYIINTETGLFLNNSGKYSRVMWRDKPRIFNSGAGLKQSIGQMLRILTWDELTDGQKQPYMDSAIRESSVSRPPNEAMLRFRASKLYYNTIKHKPLEELLPPPLELRELSL